MCTMWDAIKDQTGIILLRVVTASMWTNDCCRGSCEFCLWIAKTLLLRVIATFVVHVVPVHENDMDQKFISDLITQNHRIINRGKVVRDFPQVTTANDCFVKCRPRKSKFLIFPQFAIKDGICLLANSIPDNVDISTNILKMSVKSMSWIWECFL